MRSMYRMVLAGATALALVVGASPAHAATDPTTLQLSFVSRQAERVRVAAQDKDMTVNFGEPAQRLTVLGDRRELVAAVRSTAQRTPTARE